MQAWNLVPDIGQRFEKYLSTRLSQVAFSKYKEKNSHKSVIWKVNLSAIMKIMDQRKSKSLETNSHKVWS